MDLINLYEAGDVRADLYLEPEDYPGEYWSLKYPGRNGSIREYNTPVLRLAEMYLIRAEALLEDASVPGATALNDFNAVRIHRGLAAASSVTLNDIYAERRRELCFEGNELFDLARTGRSLSRTDFTGLVNKNVIFTPVARQLSTTYGPCLYHRQKLTPMSTANKTRVINSKPERDEKDIFKIVHFRSSHPYDDFLRR